MRLQPLGNADCGIPDEHAADEQRVDDRAENCRKTCAAAEHGRQGVRKLRADDVEHVLVVVTRAVHRPPCGIAGVETPRRRFQPVEDIADGERVPRDGRAAGVHRAGKLAQPARVPCAEADRRQRRDVDGTRRRPCRLTPTRGCHDGADPRSRESEGEAAVSGGSRGGERIDDERELGRRDDEVGVP